MRPTGLLLLLLASACHTTARQEAERADAVGMRAPPSSSSSAETSAASALPSTAPYAGKSSPPTAISGALTPPDRAWVRKLVFEESCGKNAAGSGVVIGHQLVVHPDGTAELDADGFQTMTRIGATTSAAADRLEIKFAGDGPENMFPHPWPAGEVLLVLRREGAAIVTEWRAYQPSCAPARTGKAFH